MYCSAVFVLLLGLARGADWPVDPPPPPPDPPAPCDWQPWTDCVDFEGNPVECGGGYRYRRVFDPNDPSCTPSSQVVACNTQPCVPEVCTVSEWGCWTACSHPCGDNGVKSRSRQVLVPGVLCDDEDSDTRLHECDVPCNRFGCPQDCVETAAWSLWSEIPCTATCGGGVEVRDRTIVTLPVERPGADEICPPAHEERPCGVVPCPIDCVWGEWGPWSEPTATCGEATRTRTRSIATYPQNGGANCDGGTTETQDVTDQIDCSTAILLDQCLSEASPTFLSAGDCPTSAVYCPGWNKEGTVIDCEDGESWSRTQKRCMLTIWACPPNSPPWGKPWGQPWGAPWKKPPPVNNPPVPWGKAPWWVWSTPAPAPPFTKFPPPSAPPAKTGARFCQTRPTGFYEICGCCRNYVKCVQPQGSANPLSCDPQYAFDQAAGTCVYYTQKTACNNQLPSNQQFFPWLQKKS